MLPIEAGKFLKVSIDRRIQIKKKNKDIFP